MRKFLLCTCIVLLASSAVAQPRDCKSITNSAERLKCYDQPKDCKSITDGAERLKCFDTQPAGAPAAAPAASQETPLLRIVKKEPPVGQLPTGTEILVDDGSCPAGKIKKVVAGDVTIGEARRRSCVPHP
jgi:hypothetical protein